MLVKLGLMHPFLQLLFGGNTYPFVLSSILPVQDNSNFYRHLAEYCDSPDTAAKMHKRRADMLGDMVNQLNSQYFLAICKQLHYELGEIYAEMMRLKMAKLNSAAQPEPAALIKINKLYVE
eukprot:TRINITY_DN11636_c0_g1_i10.p1 TRINITY_DN11636_c0_g1~~TRINITY_DN11636_c0_g1_i10.p1  ORF type:complete len:121 (+),score=25.59 TRINITY_DN11636_c0_g1_i10:235-597(+)